MPDLTFFTTNQTKLAHARYLAEGRHISIKGFRQRTYHAGYVEPRLTSRGDILQASYESAKSQLGKAGFSEASHAFILEDTSVRIDALSASDKEVPGVDIKYWMQDQTFAGLDTLLKAAGNDRRVTVRSDILLHAPANFRLNWASGLESEYVIFTGEQQGRIADTELPFSSNIVYPWLDNKSFNKWFIPDGENAPFGALPIEIADAVDFRGKSFVALFDFLESKHYLSIPRTQFNFQLDRQVNIILCGYTCSGKTTASQYLTNQFGYLHVEASDFMHLSYYYRHGYPGPTSIGDFAEQALRQQPNIAAEKVAEYVSENLEKPIVISGFRSLLEIEFLEASLVSKGKKFIKCFINASEMARFSRLLARSRPGDNLDIFQFRDRDLQQKRMGLDDIHRSCLFSEIQNEQSLEAYTNRPLC